MRCPLIVAIVSQELLEVWGRLHLLNIGVRWEDRSQERGALFDAATAVVKDGITVNAIAPALIETDMVTTNPEREP